jgi:type III secretory pathway component EscT
LRFAAPVMLALLLAEVGLGLINRSTPQFDVYRIGMPVKNLIAVVVILLSASVWSEVLVQMYREDAAALRALISRTAQPVR